MANRRQGYGGGRSYYNSGPVNPWQVGNAPGNQGGQFNNGNQSNLLSQLSEPQAQLALAITKLLQPQQQVPSLLTMNTVNPLHNSGGYGNNNFPHRGRGNMNNRRPQPGMKPYNKMNSRNNRDTDFNRRRGNSNKKTQPQQRNPVVSKPKKPSSTKASSKSPGKTTEVKKSPSVTEESDEKPSPMDTTETAVKETDDKSEDTEQTDVKREWKVEKQEIEEESKEDDEPAEEGTSDEKEKPTEESSQGDGKSGKYEGIPKEFLHCHICQKKMWDGESFEKHMHGRAHQQMFEKVEESYRIKADMMRESIRLTEEKHNIEMDRMKRLGKKTKTQQLSRCAMCDLDFYGQLFVHRKSASHQKLKHFLHPRCSYCNKEFPTRMEWENHRHTAEHLRKKAENGDKKGKSSKSGAGTDDEGILMEDECFIVIDSTESDDPEEANAVIDLTDDIVNIPEIQIPSYKPNRAVGLSLITPINGYFCKPCNRFFLTEKASQQHAQSVAHFDSFINILNEKVAENEEKKRKAVEADDDEGNWKRRKTSKEGEDDSKMDETGDEEKMTTANGDEFYDPSETFTATDPNDLCLDDSNIENSTLNDEVWSEVDTKIDEILEESKTEPEPQPVPPPATSPAKQASPVKTPAKQGRPQRAIRGRRNN